MAQNQRLISYSRHVQIQRVSKARKLKETTTYIYLAKNKYLYQCYDADRCHHVVGIGFPRA